jgi:hypothetical protein
VSLVPTPADPGADVRPGYESLPAAFYRAHPRLVAMDANGVLAALSFPTFKAFAGTTLQSLPDRDLSLAVVVAYNDWQADEWAAEGPGRLIPLGVLPTWDVDAATSEAKRLAAKNVTALTLSELPYTVDLPSFLSQHWDPLLRTLCEHDQALFLRPPPAPDMLSRPQDGPPKPFASLDDLFAPQLAATVCTDLIVSGVFHRFPDLRVAIAGGGIGWIPFLLDRVDLHLQNQTWSGLDLGGYSGTEVFRRHVLGCFVSDASSLFLHQRIGVEAIAWQSSYPLVDTTSPLSPEALSAELTAAGVSAEERASISSGNVCRFIRFDPFAERAREVSTVAALRTRANGPGDPTASR